MLLTLPGHAPMPAQHYIWIFAILGLALYFLDHLGRYNAMENDKLSSVERDRLYRPPGNYEPFSALFDAFGKMTELIYAPVGMALGAIGSASELLWKPVSMGIDAAAKISELLWKPLTVPLAMIGAIGKKY
jgi:hypothetical protein